MTSFPGEPGPVATITKPCVLRNCWSARTSSPDIPTIKFRVKPDDDDTPPEVIPRLSANPGGNAMPFEIACKTSAFNCALRLNNNASSWLMDEVEVEFEI